MSFITKRWGAPFIIKHRTRFELSGLPGLIVAGDDGIAGLLLWVDRRAEVELLTLDAVIPGRGIGSSLLDTCLDQMLPSDCRRVLVTVTNDQLIALRMLQKRGFRLTGLRPGAVDDARKLKPQIPVNGADGVPLHDELDLTLARWPTPTP